MEVHELLIDLFDRVAEHVQEAVDGLGADALITPPEPGANPIGWLVWHLTRVQDHHISEILERDQEWIEGKWAGRFGVAPDPRNTGYGHSWKEVMSVRPENAGVLVAYYSAVAARTRQLLDSTTAADLDRVVDERWDPPVTLGVRLISVADDDIQHGAQAVYVRGILDRR
ncbi:MAG TPA: DUF664 domain-containing protein [Ilumatobacteraceae bacterium]|jgi:hypothetical protein